LTAYPRVLPVGDSALTVELGDAIDPAINARVRTLDRALQSLPLEKVSETVPTYRSLLVLYDPRGATFGEIRDAILTRAAEASAGDEAPGVLRLVPTRYGGDEGPDLTAVARQAGLSEAEVISLHGEREYTAYMLGFTPGFAYLGEVPQALSMPRRATPRVRVPAGSVALSGSQTGIYPSASPGGWNVIGRTSLRLFDPRLDPPALILPGDRVRFVPVPELPSADASPAVVPAGRCDLEVLDGGLLTTIQDAGRFGYRRLGVTQGGPMDAAAHRAANRLVGNPEGAAALECTIAGPSLRFAVTAAFAITGADLGAFLERADKGDWEVPLSMSVLARAGNVLTFRGRRAGCRAYIAFAGGIDVPPVLGSRATDLTAGLGGLEGRGLRAGDRLALCPGARVSIPSSSRTPPPAPSEAVTVRVVLGPQADLFTPDALSRFLSEAYSVTPVSDRVGCRLSGSPLRHAGAAEIVTDGMVFGSVQVPPDGQPIVMMADAPTTGGYPKIATVVAADLPLAAQLVPGAGRLSFRAVSVDEGQRTGPPT
jgi:KipI family sensor histidine kinase inhibitor